MAIDALLMAVGLALLLAGGLALVAGASQMAAALGVSELAIGLTVVAFGTSAPELAVNTLAAWHGNSAIAFGNVIGSNIANVALVLGLSALVLPLRIEGTIVSREIPMMLLATAAAVVLGLDRLWETPEQYDRVDGLILLTCFSMFLYYSVSQIIGDRRQDPLAVAADHVPTSSFWTTGRATLLAAGGLVVLLAGAQLTVARAVSLAESLDVSRAVIGLTVIAFGTSLPELVTCLIATWKGQTNLAVGNIVGSNIFNLLFILGATSTIRPVEVPALGGSADLIALVMFSVALVPLSRANGSHIVRWEGIALLLAYLGYLSWRVLG